MRTRLLPRWTMVLWMLAPLLVSTACLTFGGGAPLKTPTAGLTPAVTETTERPTATPLAPAATAAPPLTPGSPAATPQTAGTPGSEEISAQGEVVFGPGAFKFLDPAAGLTALGSYKATLSISFIGTEAGQPSHWSKTSVLLSQGQPLARQLTIEKSGQLPEPDPQFMAEVGGLAYARRGAEPCTASLIEPGVTLSELAEPASALIGVIGAEAAGSETINGIATDHYTFDERALGQTGLAKSTGEIWIASQGGYVAAYALTTQAGSDYFGAGIEGTATWRYDLTDINQPVTIQLPKDCPAGKVNAPQLPDAADVVNLPGLLSYTTGSSPAEAAAFYLAQLPDLGWQPAGDPIVTDTTALQDFTQSDQQLSVIVTQDESGTTVQLALALIGP